MDNNGTVLTIPDSINFDIILDDSVKSDGRAVCSASQNHNTRQKTSSIFDNVRFFQKQAKMFPLSLRPSDSKMPHNGYTNSLSS